MESNEYPRRPGPVAQRLEQRTHNSWVGGSNPPGPYEDTQGRARDTGLCCFQRVRQSYQHTRCNGCGASCVASDSELTWRKDRDGQTAAKHTARRAAERADELRDALGCDCETARAVHYGDGIANSNIN